MALKVMTIFLLKIILINFILLACFCEGKPKKRPPQQSGGAPAPNGGGKPAAPSNCYCETFEKLCFFTKSSSMIDIRIANTADEELTCTSNEYVYCDLNHNSLDRSCGVRKIRSSTDLFGAHPWHVTMYLIDKVNTYIGSGVLITRKHVLTAAHKVYRHLKSPFKLRLGEWDHHLGEECNIVEAKPAEIQIHPQFDQIMLFNDVALIRLDKEIPLVDYPHVNTACIAKEVPENGTNCFVAGWGDSRFKTESYPLMQLKEVELPLVAHETCENALRTTRLGHSYKLNRDSFICAGGELGRDTCTGDGGAPLMCENENKQYEVVGLVAWGIGCASKNPGVYVNVPKFRDWITNQIYLTS